MGEVGHGHENGTGGIDTQPAGVDARRCGSAVRGISLELLHLLIEMTGSLAKLYSEASLVKC